MCLDTENTLSLKKKKIGKEEKKFVKSVDKEKIVDSQSTVWKLRKFFLFFFKKVRESNGYEKE